MAKKKNRAGVAQPFPSMERRVSLESLEDLITDPRPTESPYKGDNVDVVFGSRANPFRVPKTMLQKCSNLPDLVSDTLRLDNISEEAGHVLIHHLYTGTFQCLAPQGITGRERHSNEFVTCIEAYKAALHYNLAALAEKSQGEIERLGAALTFPEILALLTKAYPNPDVDDIWISNYLQARMSALFSDNVAMREATSRHSRSTSSIAEIPFDNIVRLRVDEIPPQCFLNEFDVETLRNTERPDTVSEPDSVEVAHDPNMESDSESKILTPLCSSWTSSVDDPPSFEYVNEVATTDREIGSSTNIETKTKINKRKRNRKRGKRVRDIMKTESEAFGCDEDPCPNCKFLDAHVTAETWKDCPGCLGRILVLVRDLATTTRLATSWRSRPPVSCVDL
ncbi:hypothetical protein SCAR479_06770 [Seiridium cardinale]|uniref:BTB domain-containing protein n=1 Tax=Seiridium cardinale TaxID=138064 RepID=A0ABR2XRR7_9PEZI